MYENLNDIDEEGNYLKVECDVPCDLEFDGVCCTTWKPKR